MLQRAQLHANGQAALQFRQHIAWLGNVESARRDEQYMVGFHRPIFGRDGGSFNQG